MQEHIKTIGAGAVTEMMTKLVSMVGAIVTIPLLLRAVGSEQYGLYVLITSLAAFVGFSEFGLTTAITNQISYWREEKRFGEIAKLFNGSLLFYAIFTLPLYAVIAFIFFQNVIPTGELLGLDAVLVDTANILIILVFLTTLINAVFSGVMRSLYFGMNQVVFYNVFHAGYGAILVLSFIGFLLLEPSIVGVAIFFALFAGIRFLFLVGAAKYRFPWLHVSLSLGKIKAIKPLFQHSLIFLVLSLIATIISKMDPIILPHFLGVSAVTIYILSDRLFDLPSSLVRVIDVSRPTIAGLWQLKDFNSLQKLYTQIIRMNMLSRITIVGFLLVYSKEILSVWVGAEFFHSYALMGLFALIYLNGAWIGPHIDFINSMSLHKSQLKPYIIYVVVDVILSVILVQYIGIPGVVIGSLVGALLTISFTAPHFLKKQLNIQPWQELGKMLIASIIPLLVLLGLHFMNVEFIKGLLPQFIFAVFSFGAFALLMFHLTLLAVEKKYIVSTAKEYLLKRFR